MRSRVLHSAVHTSCSSAADLLNESQIKKLVIIGLTLDDPQFLHPLPQRLRAFNKRRIDVPGQFQVRCSLLQYVKRRARIRPPSSATLSDVGSSNPLHPHVPSPASRQDPDSCQ